MKIKFKAIYAKYQEKKVIQKSESSRAGVIGCILAYLKQKILSVLSFFRQYCTNQYNELPIKAYGFAELNVMLIKTWRDVYVKTLS